MKQVKVKVKADPVLKTNITNLSIQVVVEILKFIIVLTMLIKLIQPINIKKIIHKIYKYNNRWILNIMKL